MGFPSALSAKTDTHLSTEGFNMALTPGSKKVIFVTVFLSVVFFLLAVFGPYLYTKVLYGIVLKIAGAQYRELPAPTSPGPTSPDAVFSIPQIFNVKLADTDEDHFIRTKITLGFETGDKVTPEELARRQTDVSEAITSVLKSKKKNRLDSVGNQLDLRVELKLAVNNILRKGKVTQVYFEQFVVY